MQVLFLSGSGELGGAERSLVDIVASLRQAQPTWALRVLSPADGPLLAAAQAAGALAEVLPLAPALARIGEPAGDSSSRARLATRLARSAAPLADYVRRLRAQIRATSPDIVHTHALKAHLLAAWANPGPASAIWHLHDYVGRRPATAALLRSSLGRCTAIVANSVSVAEDAREALGARVPIVPVLNGVDLRRFAPDGPRLNLDRSGDVPPARPAALRVGLVATFGRWKGHLTFLEACTRLPRELSVHAYIIGGPLYQTEGSQHSLDELRAYAAAAGIGDRVTFTGVMANVPAALRALDIVVHASTEPEPFGLVIAEAMACGRPVIAADAGGARELVAPGVDALVHEPGNAGALAARICELAADADLRARLGAAARLTAERRFDRVRLASELVPVYERAVSRQACA